MLAVSSCGVYIICPVPDMRMCSTIVTLSSRRCKCNCKGMAGRQPRHGDGAAGAGWRHRKGLRQSGRLQAAAFDPPGVPPPTHEGAGPLSRARRLHRIQQSLHVAAMHQIETCVALQCVQHDEKGSATALLHMCVKVSDKRFLFFFACLGDTEVRLKNLRHKLL